MPFDPWRGMANILHWQRELMEDYSQHLVRAGKFWNWAVSPPEIRVGLTPKDIVYQEHKPRLYRYHSRDGTVQPTPILIVYALINRLYILDLYPGRSFIEFLRNEGLQVYAVDWGVAGDEDRGISLDYYVEGYLDRMVDTVRNITGSPRITLFGYCIGGTLAAVYAALHPEKIRNLVLLTTPIDFEAGGYLRTVVDKDHFPVDRIVNAFGNIPPWFMQTGFKLLNPLGDLVKSYNLYKHIPEEGFLKYYLAIEKWVNDSIPFPGEAYRKFIKDFYQENKLYRGLLEISGRRVKLRDISANHLTVAGREDTIAPAASAVCIRDLISSEDNTAVTLPGGHIGVIVGGRALKTTWPWMGDWLLERSA